MNEDEEVLEFGIKRENEERRDGGCAVVFDPETQKYGAYLNLRNNKMGLFGGGFDEGEDEKTGVLRELVEESGLIDFLHTERVGKVFTHYYNSNKDVNRVAYATCFLVILNSKNRQDAKLEEHEKFELVWVTKDEIIKHWDFHNVNKDYDHWIYLMNKAVSKAVKLGHDKTSFY